MYYKRINVYEENNTNRTIGYSEPFHLEVKKDGDWYKLTPLNDLVFTVHIWHLALDDVKLNIPWENFYGSLDVGEYRFIKDVYFFENDEISEEFYIRIEFYYRVITNIK